MENRPRPRRYALASVLLAVALLAGCGGGGSGGEPAYTVPVKVVSHKKATLVLVPVTIDGRGPYTFVLDTGASTSAIDSQLAKRLHLRHTGNSRVVRGVVSKTHVPLVRVENWRLGEHATLADTSLTANKLGDFGQEGIAGLLGSDELSGFGEVTVDYADSVLRLQHGQH